jgi:hypothetical protein
VLKLLLASAPCACSTPEPSTSPPPPAYGSSSTSLHGRPSHPMDPRPMARASRYIECLPLHSPCRLPTIMQQRSAVNPQPPQAPASATPRPVSLAKGDVKQPRQ